MKEKETIREMPDKELLEDFVKSLHGPVTVQFNLEEGRFERVKHEERQKPKDI